MGSRRTSIGGRHRLSLTLATAAMGLSLVVGAFSSGASAGPAASRIVFTGIKGLTTAEVSGVGEKVVLSQESAGTDCPYEPRWSPDGSWIAYMCHFNIWIVRPDGTDNHLLSGLRSNGPSWSADGHTVYFTYLIGGTDTMIMGVNLDRTVAPTFDPGRTGADASVAWSRDGSRVAFSSDRGDGRFRIYTRNVDGSGLRAITTGEWDDQAQAWSPDGRRLLATAVHNSGTQLVVMDADGSNRRALRSDAVAQAWSPDGQWILFYEFTGGPLEVMRADGSSVATLSFGGTADWGPGSVNVTLGSTTVPLAAVPTTAGPSPSTSSGGARTGAAGRVPTTPTTTQASVRASSPRASGIPRVDPPASTPDASAGAAPANGGTAGPADAALRHSDAAVAPGLTRSSASSASPVRAPLIGASALLLAVVGPLCVRYGVRLVR